MGPEVRFSYQGAVRTTSAVARVVVTANDARITACNT